MVTDDSEYAAVFDDTGSFSPTRPDILNLFQPDGAPPRKSLSRTRSISSGSSGCQSPTYDEGRGSVFGTLPRRGRKTSMRKNLLKYLPGLNHSVEEEAV